MRCRGPSTKVFVVGGSGRVGRVAAKRLAESELVSEIAIGGRDLAFATRVAEETGPKATAFKVDATDEKKLAKLAKPYDLIVSTAGPDFRVALPVTRAAIDAGIAGCDIAADGPSLEKALALNKQARDAGVTFVTGIGHTPGISNLLMQHAANQLDAVEDVQLCVWWDLGGENIATFGDPEEMRTTGRVNASWQTVLTWVTGPVRTYRDGRLVAVDPFEDATEVTLPKDGGTVSAVPIGSTEPITIPRRIPGVRSVSIRMALLPPQLNEILRENTRRIAEGTANAAAATMAFLDTITADPNRWLKGREDVPTGFGMMATAIGRKEKRKVRYSCWPAGPWESTVGPLTTAALWILQGKVRLRGVIPPEAAFDPIPFLREAARFRLKSTPTRLLGESVETLP